MNELRFILVADGNSDNTLILILKWLLVQNGIACAVNPEFSDLRNLSIPRKDLAERIIKSLELYPCDVLFIHRDTENESREKRIDEINTAIDIIRQKVSPPPCICVIPVRMTEAWLLIDEQAIKKAAGNPNNKEKLDLPRLHILEELPDPKEVLYSLLRKACGLQGRKLNQFQPYRHAVYVTQNITDFSLLRLLPAFLLLEENIKKYISTLTIDR